MRLRTHVVVTIRALVRRSDPALLPGVVRLGTPTVDIQKEAQVGDNLKEKAVGTSNAAPQKAKVGLGAKDSVKQSVPKGGAAPTGAKDSAPVGAKDGTLGAKD